MEEGEEMRKYFCFTRKMKDEQKERRTMLEPETNSIEYTHVLSYVERCVKGYDADRNSFDINYRKLWNSISGMKTLKTLKFIIKR